MTKLCTGIELHIGMFRNTVDQIRQGLAEAKAIQRNKNVYEDIARLKSFQSNRAKQTREINHVLNDSKSEFEKTGYP